MKLTDLHPRPDQPRKHFDAAGLEELAASLRELGMVEPIVAAPDPAGGYRIIAGERRWRAAALAGLDEVPVVVREDLTDDAAAFEVAMVENVMREDMNPMETARGYQRLLDYGQTLDDVSRRTGVAKRKVQSALSLLKLDEPIAGLVETGQLDEWTGTRLATLSHNGQHRALRVIREHGLTGTDRDRVIGQVWCDENEYAMFDEAAVPVEAERLERIRNAREIAGRVARLLEQLDEELGKVRPDEETVLVVESVAKTAARVARVSRQTRVARLIAAS